LPSALLHCGAIAVRRSGSIFPAINAMWKSDNPAISGNFPLLHCKSA
jgi:hypothetical protein